MEKVKVKAKDVIDGDILFISHEYLEAHNKHLLDQRRRMLLASSDTIIIVDETAGYLQFIINGGNLFTYVDEDDVFEKIGHYSKLKI